MEVNEYNQTCIVNDFEKVTDNKIKIDLILKSIFKIKKITGDYQIIRDLLIQNKDQIHSYENINDALRMYLNEKINNSTEKDKYVAMLNSVILHDMDTTQNRLAYVPQTKTNPQAVFWPDPTLKKGARSLFNEIPIATEHKILNPETPIGSAGSCFAMEIAFKLQEEGFNYVITEKNPHSEKPYNMACAAWGIIFNTPSMRQLVEKAFGARKLPRLLWSYDENDKTVYRDPFREDVVFNSVEEYEKNYDEHINATRKALQEVKVFVMTLGVNEVWFLKSDGSAFSRSPWKLASYLVEKKVMTVEDNVNELQKMLDLWRIYNPDLQLIVTVSPVPLSATFRANDYHVITANAHSKATLRISAEIFASKNQGVYYFPSYETVMYCTKNPWQEDQRHVSREAVGNVMRLFDTMFVNKTYNNDFKSELYQKAEIDISEKNYDEAINKLNRLLTIDKNNPEIFYKLGFVSFKQGKYEEAIDYFSESLENGMCNYDLCFYISEALEKTGDNETAEIYKEKANELKK